MKRQLLFVVLACTLTLGYVAPARAAYHGFRVLNQGRHVMTAVQISTPFRRLWAPNLLRARVGPGGGASFSIGEGCLEDVRITYSNGHWLQQNNVNTCRVNVISHY
jgi:hypothetical protein